MISQIDIEKTLQLQPNKECLFVSLATVLNHVVDVVNELQHDNSEKANCQENVQDKFAKQRRWIGTLCRFWDFESETPKHFGILTMIDETAIVKYEADNGFWYHGCEPVKPDDDIIYRGE